MFNDTQTAFANKTNWGLKRAYYLFRLIDNPFLTKVSAVVFRIPYITKVAPIRWMIKKTIFKQFVAGENTNQALKVSAELAQYNVGSILDYSVEGQEYNEEFDETTAVILELISIARDTPEIPFVVFKPTGIGAAKIYTKVQSQKKLTPQEEKDCQKIKTRFRKICQKAFDEKVTVMVDAEESWIQSIVDKWVLDLMREFNQQSCIVCNTLQFYRHDRLAYLKQLFEIAEKEDFLLGFKVVRGAYMEKERERAKEKGYPSPIQADKASSDQDFNTALEFIVENNHRISLFAGTHNESSCELLTKLIANKNLPKDYPKIWFGQLLGMSDNISFKLAKMGYNVAKYLPYGPIEDVMPYLLRRAQENTSVQGQSGRELSLIIKEIKRRKHAK